MTLTKNLWGFKIIFKFLKTQTANSFSNSFKDCESFSNFSSSSMMLSWNLSSFLSLLKKQYSCCCCFNTACRTERAEEIFVTHLYSWILWFIAFRWCWAVFQEWLLKYSINFWRSWKKFIIYKIIIYPRLY